MHNTFGKVLTVLAIGESLPNPRSYVDLSPDKVDEVGMRPPISLEDVEDLFVLLSKKDVREPAKGCSVSGLFPVSPSRMPLHTALILFTGAVKYVDSFSPSHMTLSRSLNRRPTHLP